MNQEAQSHPEVRGVNPAQQVESYTVYPGRSLYLLKCHGLMKPAKEKVSQQITIEKSAEDIVTRRKTGEGLNSIIKVSLDDA
jgi:hypothetical protein